VILTSTLLYILSLFVLSIIVYVHSIPAQINRGCTVVWWGV
jgi:hypothetical protein